MTQEVALGLSQDIEEPPEIFGELIERKGLRTTRMGEVTVPAEIRSQPSDLCVQMGQAMDEIVAMARQSMEQYKRAAWASDIGIGKLDRS